MIRRERPHPRWFGVVVGACIAGAIGALALVRAAAGQPEIATTPGEVRVDTTYENLGYQWAIEGDADRDGTVFARFRELGQTVWREALPPVRTHRDLVGEGNGRPANRWAGSIFWLEPGSTYEIELALADPDGGGETRVVTGTTRSPLTHTDDLRLLRVVPGNGGGSGSASDPFRGLQAAADAAMPGDTFTLGPGGYLPFQLFSSGLEGRPIRFVGYGPDYVIDGQGTERGVVTLGNHDRTITHVALQGMTIQNGRWGIDAQHSRDILVRFVTVRDVDYGYVNRRGDGLEGAQTICDSTFIGRTDWPAEGIPSERGIDVRGDGNVICNNRISNFGDGVSVQPFTGPSSGNDVYGNDITHIVDDPIEIDYNMANARVWANRITNGRMGVSLAPIYGGPAYVFRNVFFNLESSAYKMNREPAGLVIVHNTSLKQGNGTSSPRNWQNTFLRNNYLFGTRYVFEEYGLAEGSVDDWDYDALARDPVCGGDTPPCFKWNNTRYDTLNDLIAGAGIEAHGVVASRDDLTAPVLPGAYETPVARDGYDLRLRAGAPEIDAGMPLPNLNDPWVSDGQPDIGAYEFPSDLPRYGPRVGPEPITFLPWSHEPPTPVASPTATVANPTATRAGPTATEAGPTATRSGPTASAGVPTVTPTRAPSGAWRVYLPATHVGP